MSAHKLSKQLRAIAPGLAPGDLRYEISAFFAPHLPLIGWGRSNHREFLTEVSARLAENMDQAWLAYPKDNMGQPIVSLETLRARGVLSASVALAVSATRFPDLVRCDVYHLCRNEIEKMAHAHGMDEAGQMELAAAVIILNTARLVAATPGVTPLQRLARKLDMAMENYSATLGSPEAMKGAAEEIRRLAAAQVTRKLRDNGL